MRLLRTFTILVFLVLMAMALTGCVVYRSISKTLPDPDLRKARGRDQSSFIVDRAGGTLAQLYAEQRRQDVAFERIPPHVREAVIATEDQRYYEHEGVDPISIARALWVDLLKGEKAQGGSTITQQYVKQAFVSSEKTFRRKAQEAILAQRVEKRYSKDEILGLYLNTIYFGHGAYGVEAASRAYFGKSVGKLSIAEAAVIAGVIKSPARYSPYLDARAGLRRRNVVLGQMLAQGYLDQTEYDEAVGTPIKLKGLAAPSARAPYFVEWIKENLIREYGERKVYRGGLRVRTTLDPKMQKAAEEAIRRVLDRKGDPSAAIVAIRPSTGEVLAMVGGRDFKTQQYNVAVQGKRQPGSAFKPFVLATALQEGISPEKAFPSGPRTLRFDNQVWKVTGAHGGGSGGTMRLRAATEQSVNSVFAQLILDVGAEKVVDTAHELGIMEDIDPVPAIALGGLEHGVSPLEMANAYGTLAAGGKRATPYGIATVADITGDVLLKAKPRTKESIDPAVAYLTTDILTGVIKRGTGKGASIGRPAAGKTGTTQEYRDAWFVGYTPDLVAAVWVGYPDSQREMKAVHGRSVTGGSFPADIWSAFMKKALAGTPAATFKKPTGLSGVKVCFQSGGLASEFCTKTVSALVLTAHKPGLCEIHTRPVEVVVPPVVGLSKIDAIARLEAAGLKAKVVDLNVAGVGAGLVANQSPQAKVKVAPGAFVTITVSTGGGTNQTPIAKFSAPSEAKVNHKVTLDGSASSDDGQIVRYYWEFGDGKVAEGVKVSHTWAVAGTYEVILWVTDDRKKQASFIQKIIIK